MAQSRATFGPGELAVVLSHYDLGVLESVTDFDRGSRHSPKVGLVSERGKFVLKRRGISRANPDRIQVAHRVLAELAASGFPTPKLIPTSKTGVRLLRLRDHVYELFEFVGGQPYRRTAEEARDAGLLLGQLHEATSGWKVEELSGVPRGNYHDVPGARSGLCAIGSTLGSHDSFSGNEAELATLVQLLLEAYDDAADAANAAGVVALPERLIHSDWHPGNVLYRNGKVVAVLDFDTIRVSQHVSDVANGALQFSMLSGGDPTDWPEDLDEERYHAFLEGYSSASTLSDEERRMLPDLMIEALIAECVPPITRTGSVGRWSGFRVLRMVRRKVAWMATNRERLVRTTAD